MASEPQTSPELRDTRRLLRVLGAMPAHASDPTATSNAAKFVHDRLRRAGLEPVWFEPDGAAPLVIAGTGPVLVVSYIDDIDPGALEHQVAPPAFEDGVASAPGILRKAGLIAATIGTTHPDNGPDTTTLVIETDRYRGSQSLERWLSESDLRFDAAIWEAADLPVRAPAVIHSAFGQLQVRVSSSTANGHIPAMYGGVVADLGVGLATALSDLVSADHEVRLEGFYDSVSVPDEEGLALLAGMAELVQSGLERISPRSTRLPTLHLAMGVFFAPSLVVREFHTRNLNPYLPSGAEAVMDIQIVPGQSPEAVLTALRKHFNDRLEQVEVVPLLMRPAVAGTFDLAGLRAAFEQVIPTAPGPNPAGLIESRGIPTVGYATVGTSGEPGTSSVELQSIQTGAAFVHALIEHTRTTLKNAGQ